ncbi:MAG TPA: DNA-binding protein [Bacteroides sp.]|nr:DNA-binding protein [Bacteroides sp.]
MENKRIIDIQLDEFESRLEQIIDSRIIKVVSDLKEGEELLSRIQVIKRLGIAPSTLNDYTHKGILTSYRIGNRVYYKWSEILEAAIKVERFSGNS